MSTCISEVVSGIRRACERSRSGAIRGLFPSLRSGSAIAWSSHAELALLQRLEFDWRVARFDRNERALKLDELEGVPTFRPAFRCITQDGCYVLLDCSSGDPCEESATRLKAMVERSARHAGVQYRMVGPGGLGGPRMLRIIDRLAGLRSEHVDDDALAAVRSAVGAGASAGVTLDALAACPGGPSVMWTAACSLAAKGNLRLSPSTDGVGHCRVTDAGWKEQGQ